MLDQIPPQASETNGGQWDWNVDSHQASYSPRFWSLLGFGAEAEFPAARIESYTGRVHSADLGAMQEAIKRHFETGTLFDVEHRLKMANGEYRWFRSRADSAGGTGRRSLRLAGSIQDIHDQHERARQTEESERATAIALRELEFQKQALDAHAIVSACGADGKIIYVNQRACNITGYSREELLGQNHRLLNSGLHTREFWKQMYADVARDGVWNGEVCNRAKDGTFYWVRMTITAFRDLQGRIERYMAVRTEITEEKRKSQELLQARRDAEFANQVKTEFLSNMSHEIRTPLAAVLGYAELLEDEELLRTPERRAEILATIRHAGEHLLSIVNDILDLSKIEAGQLIIEHIETSLPKLLQDVVSLVRPRATSKGLNLEVSINSHIPNRVLTDPTRLRQILINLLGNAIKFTTAGRVVLRVNAESDEADTLLRIAVEDTGIGITDEQSRRIFSPFAQADPTVGRKHGGTGLGLTICRRLSEMMGGHVELTRSVPGEGSLFTAIIPMSLVAPGEATNRVPMPVHTPLPSPTLTTGLLAGRILLVEDSPANQRLFSFHLLKAGAELDVADSAAAALSLFERARADGKTYDLLLTDIQLPEMDGYTLVRLLRKRGYDLPIVALTAHAMNEDLRKCLDAGCNDYASKPIAKASLLEKCRYWLNFRRPESSLLTPS